MKGQGIGNREQETEIRDQRTENRSHEDTHIPRIVKMY